MRARDWRRRWREQRRAAISRALGVAAAALTAPIGLPQAGTAAHHGDRPEAWGRGGGEPIREAHDQRHEGRCHGCDWASHAVDAVQDTAARLEDLRMSSGGIERTFTGHPKTESFKTQKTQPISHAGKLVLNSWPKMSTILRTKSSTLFVNLRPRLGKRSLALV